MHMWSMLEMTNANIKDARRRKSMAMVLANIARQPAVAFTAAAGHGGRQAAHRLFSDEQLTIPDLLGGHYQQTVNRIQSEAGSNLVLVVQDTTEFDFTNLKKASGLGYINHTAARGIFGHAAMALTHDGLPLGLLHLNLYARDDAGYGKGAERRDRNIAEKESYRWIETLHSVEAQMPIGQHIMMVQDREGDIFALLEAPKRTTTHILVRANQPRRVEVMHQGTPQKSLLFDAAASAPVVGQMTVDVPRAPNRPSREACLILQTVELHILAPKRKGVGKDPVTAWVVRACEVNAPEGQQAIEWVLVTTLPVSDGSAAAQMVRFYSQRWSIERLHYTLKTGGCNAEQLQMDNVRSLTFTLALYYVVAWRILHITHLARVQPEGSAELVLRQSEIDVLEQAHGKAVKTTAEAVVAIAKLGGYEPYKNGPPPGVKVLWRGIRRLQDMEEGWLLALSGRKIQSEI